MKMTRMSKMRANEATDQRGGRWTKYVHVRVSQLNMLLLHSIYFSDHNLAMLVPYIMELKAAHDLMASETKTRPFYGNDTVKHFLRALIRYAIFDKAHQLNV